MLWNAIHFVNRAPAGGAPNPKVQIQEEVLLNSEKLRQVSEPIPVMENGVHKTIDGMELYYVGFVEVL